MATRSGIHPLAQPLIAAALVAALGVAGCDSAERDRMASEMKQQAGAAMQTADDAAITATVKAALAAETKLASADIAVATSEGRVTLSGRVPEPAQADEAARIAQSVKGVQAVENQLMTGSS